MFINWKLPYPSAFLFFDTEIISLNQLIVATLFQYIIEIRRMLVYYTYTVNHLYFFFQIFGLNRKYRVHGRMQSAVKM